MLVLFNYIQLFARKVYTEKIFCDLCISSAFNEVCSVQKWYWFEFLLGHFACQSVYKFPLAQRAL